MPTFTRIRKILSGRSAKAMILASSTEFRLFCPDPTSEKNQELTPETPATGSIILEGGTKTSDWALVCIEEYDRNQKMVSARLLAFETDESNNLVEVPPMPYAVRFKEAFCETAKARIRIQEDIYYLTSSDSPLMALVVTPGTIGYCAKEIFDILKATGDKLVRQDSKATGAEAEVEEDE